MDTIVGGNVFIRSSGEPMKAGQTVLGHRHNFDHVTYCPRGKLEVALLKESALDAHGWPIEASIERVTLLDSASGQNWCLIEKGRFHALRAVEDGTIYHCIYAHREPQVLTEPPGQTRRHDDYRVDEAGQMWVRVDPGVVQVSTGWEPGYQ